MTAADGRHPLYSPEIEMLIRPRAVYSRRPAVPPFYVPAYVLLFATVVAFAGSIAATGRLTFSLVLNLIACWAFLPVLHLLTGVLLVMSAKSEMSRIQALGLLLMGYAPWTLAILLAGLVAAAGYRRGTTVALVLALMAFASTCRILYAYCREILQVSRSHAVLRTFVHQGVSIAMIILYVDFAVGGLRNRI